MCLNGEELPAARTGRSQATQPSTGRNPSASTALHRANLKENSRENTELLEVLENSTHQSCRVRGMLKEENKTRKKMDVY